VLQEDATAAAVGQQVAQAFVKFANKVKPRYTCVNSVTISYT
jgi:hypothetical protein